MQLCSFFFSPLVLMASNTTKMSYKYKSLFFLLFSRYFLHLYILEAAVKFTSWRLVRTCCSIGKSHWNKIPFDSATAYKLDEMQAGFRSLHIFLTGGAKEILYCHSSAFFPLWMRSIFICSDCRCLAHHLQSAIQIIRRAVLKPNTWSSAVWQP